MTQKFWLFPFRFRAKQTLPESGTTYPENVGCSDCLWDIFQRREGKSSIHFIEQSLFPFGHVLLVFPELCMKRPCPDTAAERWEMAIGVTTRIEDLQTVSNKY